MELFADAEHGFQQVGLGDAIRIDNLSYQFTPDQLMQQISRGVVADPHHQRGEVAHGENRAERFAIDRATRCDLGSDQRHAIGCGNRTCGDRAAQTAEHPGLED